MRKLRIVVVGIFYIFLSYAAEEQSENQRLKKIAHLRVSLSLESNTIQKKSPRGNSPSSSKNPFSPRITSPGIISPRIQELKSTSSSDSILLSSPEDYSHCTRFALSNLYDRVSGKNRLIENIIASRYVCKNQQDYLESVESVLQKITELEYEVSNYFMLHKNDSSKHILVAHKLGKSIEKMVNFSKEEYALLESLKILNQKNSESKERLEAIRDELYKELNSQNDSQIKRADSE